MGFLRKILDAFRPDHGRATTELAPWLGLPEGELRMWLKGSPNAAYSYLRFTIPKRRGGERTIDAPSDDLKSLQRRVLRKLLNPLPVHPAATGFVRRRSIVDNARPHARRGTVMNLDLADFFHSIPAARVETVWRSLGWNRESARILTNICTHEERLPQGAPTSPAISNLVCRKLDARLSALAKNMHQSEPNYQGLIIKAGKAEASYTRYADDITFSFERFGWNKRRSRKTGNAIPARPPASISRSIQRTIEAIIEGEGFRIQRKKRVRIQRAHQRQTATGLVVNAQVNLPREVRRRIRAMQHRLRLGQLAPREQRELAGWESMQRMVEAGGRRGQDP